MVDAEDLKSFGHCDRVGSSPTIPTKNPDVWLSWLEHYVHIVGVGGSSPPTSTTNKLCGLFSVIFPICLQNLITVAMVSIICISPIPFL